MSRPLPCGTPSITSTRTTSASSLSAMRNAQLAPTFPAPTTVTFFRNGILLLSRTGHSCLSVVLSKGPLDGQNAHPDQANPKLYRDRWAASLLRSQRLDLGRQIEAVLGHIDVIFHLIYGNQKFLPQRLLMDFSRCGQAILFFIIAQHGFGRNVAHGTRQLHGQLYQQVAFLVEVARLGLALVRREYDFVAHLIVHVLDSRGLGVLIQLTPLDGGT